MIKMQFTNNPGYPTTQPEYFGTIHHTSYGVAASVNYDYKSTPPVRRYLCGLEPPNFPVPAIRCNKQRALSMGLWRWYWYLKGLTFH